MTSPAAVERFEVRRVPARALPAADREQLWHCYRRFADGPRGRFLATVAAADDVFLVRAAGDPRVAGFVAHRVLTVAVDGRPHTVVYSQYADLVPGARGLNLLQRVALRELVRLKLRHPRRPVLWMFTASTYLSYLLLCRNAVEYWPHPARPMPPGIRALRDRVMETLHGEEWDAASGRLRRHGALRYREGVVTDAARLTDDHIRFYAALNPRQDEGDSLACVCPASARNVAALLARMARRAWRRPGSPRAVPRPASA